MYKEDGPPLPLGQQLRGGAEPEILRAVHLLYWPYILSQPLSRHQPLHQLYPRGLENLHCVFSPRYCGFHTFSTIWRSSVRSFHLDYVWHPGICYLVWWDWYWDTQKRRGTLGEKIQVEVHASSFWKILPLLVLSFLKAESPGKTTRIPDFSLDLGRGYLSELFQIPDFSFDLGRGYLPELFRIPDFSLDLGRGYLPELFWIPDFCLYFIFKLWREVFGKVPWSWNYPGLHPTCLWRGPVMGPRIVFLLLQPETGKILKIFENYWKIEKSWKNWKKSLKNLIFCW